VGIRAHLASLQVQWLRKGKGYMSKRTSKEKMEVSTQPFNRLTPAEAERLALLAEECGEVIQAVGKILRHGYESTHPNFTETNRTQLMKEIGDIYAAVSMMTGARDLDPVTINRFSEEKTRKVRKYMHCQEKP
jgi:NTP pyrophosphatase (non-canonical NTP hydrolase)